MIRDIILAVLTTVVLFLFVQNGQFKIKLENMDRNLYNMEKYLHFKEREEKE